MKRFITVVAMCALLVGAGTAIATTYTWDDSESASTWKELGMFDASNWNPTGYPGKASDADNAIIDDSLSPTNDPNLESDETIADLTMRDGTDGSHLTLTIGDPNSLSTNVTLSVEGNFTHDANSTASYVEIARVASGTGIAKLRVDNIIIGDATYAVNLFVTNGGEIVTYEDD